MALGQVLVCALAPECSGKKKTLWERGTKPLCSETDRQGVLKSGKSHGKLVMKCQGKGVNVTEMFKINHFCHDDLPLIMYPFSQFCCQEKLNFVREKKAGNVTFLIVR